LRFGVVPQHFATDAGIGVDFVEAGLLQPLLVDQLLQLRHFALAPQQIAFIVVDKHQRGEVEIDIGGNGDGELVVFPLRQAEEQVALAAQQAEGGLVEADDVADDRHQTVRERQRQDHPGGRHQEAGAQRKRFFILVEHHVHFASKR
jgi:hypothetical protein